MLYKKKPSTRGSHYCESKNQRFLFLNNSEDITQKAPSSFSGFYDNLFPLSPPVVNGFVSFYLRSLTSFAQVYYLVRII